jgi:hypothetical protein
MDGSACLDTISSSKSHRNGGKMIKKDGIKYKYVETAELIERAQIESYSVSRREYEESHVDATMANHRAVGYTMMAEELEPYNSYVLWQRCFIAELSGKSVKYMLNITINTIAKMQLCDIEGYGKPDNWRKQTIRTLKYALKDYVKDHRKDKLYQVMKA